MQLRIYGLIALVVTAISYLVLWQLFNWGWYQMAIIALSTATFVLYGLDKFDATRHGDQAQHRVPKNLLHLLALLGGFPGGWLGMFLFWHKIRQLAFWAVLTVSTVIHTMLLLFVF